MWLLINVKELWETLCPYEAAELMNQDCQLQEQQASHRRLIKLAQAKTTVWKRKSWKWSTLIAIYKHMMYDC